MPSLSSRLPHDDRLVVPHGPHTTRAYHSRRSDAYLLALERDRRARINTLAALVIASLLTALAGLLLAWSMIAAVVP